MWNNRRIGYWVEAWWPVALGVMVIGFESTEWFGSDRTDRPLHWIFVHLFGTVSDDRWERIHHHIRKAGHFFGYGLIGLAWLRAWWMTLPQLRFRAHMGLAMASTAVMASLDEFHQSFVHNRNSSLRDFMLDCSGALVLQLLVYVVFRIGIPKKLKRA